MIQDKINSGWGGSRPGSGRKASPSTLPSKVIRVPISKLPEIEAVLSGSDNSPIKPATGADSVALEQVRAVVDGWRAASAGKEHKPRWHHFFRLLSELQAVLVEKGKP